MSARKAQPMGSSGQVPAPSPGGPVPPSGASHLLARGLRSNRQALRVELAAHRAPFTGNMAMAPMRAQAPATP
jgi:hypothetical protein